MKDYTKYDFAAIVGAEVEIHYHAGEPLIVKLINFNNKAKILACVVLAKNAYDMPVGRIDYTHVSEIASITAKIKVEDMSVKQLKRVLDEDVYNSVVFSRDENVIYEQMEIASELSGDYIERNYNDYIDCTDWGWKHE